MKKLLKQIIILAIFSVGFQTLAQQTPASKQTEAISITGVTAHIGNGTVINNATIVFEDGKITAIGDANTPTKGTVINAQGKHIYPGFIAPNTTLGLGEIGAVRPTLDIDEIGDMNPHIRALIAYNAESKVTESMRPNGVLIGQVTPRGGTISGTSSIMQFDAWNWEDAAVKINDGIHLNWPNTFTRGRWWLGEDPGFKPNKKYAEEVSKLQMYIDESKAYLKGGDVSKNLSFEAMKGIFDGSQKLYVHVHDEKGITSAVSFSKANGINNMVIVGGYEAYKVTDLLKNNNIPVLLQRVHRTPNTDDDDYDLPYKLASLLVNKGILVGLESSGQMERMNTRNLPFYAGTTVAYGLDKEQALQLITSNTAKILGIDDMYGTLEVGKSATLFISEGDALDMRTNQLTRAFIDGRDISLETHQTELWKRYMKKYSEE